MNENFSFNNFSEEWTLFFKIPYLLGCLSRNSTEFHKFRGINQWITLWSYAHLKRITLYIYLKISNPKINLIYSSKHSIWISEIKSEIYAQLCYEILNLLHFFSNPNMYSQQLFSFSMYLTNTKLLQGV